MLIEVARSRIVISLKSLDSSTFGQQAFDAAYSILHIVQVFVDNIARFPL